MIDYKMMAAQLESLAEEDNHFLPVLSNASALIFEQLPDLNWAGFYLLKNGQLVLGPFQGKVACIHIPVGKGVCGTCVAEDRVQLVKNVHEFPGHIACDSASNSEVVLPIHKDGNLVGVLDMDSPLLDRFTGEDAQGLQLLVDVLEHKVEFCPL